MDRAGRLSPCQVYPHRRPIVAHGEAREVRAHARNSVACVHRCLVQLKIARDAPRLLGRNLNLDDPSAARPDLHCNFGDRSIRACRAAASTQRKSLMPAVPAALSGTHPAQRFVNSSVLAGSGSRRQDRDLQDGRAQSHFCGGYLLQRSVSITVGQVRRKSRRRSRHRP